MYNHFKIFKWPLALLLPVTLGCEPSFNKQITGKLNENICSHLGNNFKDNPKAYLVIVYQLTWAGKSFALTPNTNSHFTFKKLNGHVQLKFGNNQEDIPTALPDPHFFFKKIKVILYIKKLIFSAMKSYDLFSSID